jgi:Mrp family chromosome partitioning ATPase
MPPGTGDVPLTVYQSLPVDATVVVSTPQSLVQMVVQKAKTMADMLNIPVLGLVENMSYLSCPDCGKRIALFGEENGLDEAARRMEIPLLAKLPISADVSRLCDSGEIERVVCEEIDPAVDAVEAFLK